MVFEDRIVEWQSVRQSMLACKTSNQSLHRGKCAAACLIGSEGSQGPVAPISGKPRLDADIKPWLDMPSRSQGVSLKAVPRGAKGWLSRLRDEPSLRPDEVGL